MDDKIFFLISCPKGFSEKFTGFLRNLNIVNGGKVIDIEDIYSEDNDIVAVPKNDEES